MASQVKAKQNPVRVMTETLPPIPFDRKRTGMLIVDMQYLDAHPSYGMLKRVIESGLQSKFQWYIDRLKLIQGNIRRVQEAFRQKNMEVIHVKIMSLTKNGRDRSLAYKLIGFHAAPDSKEAEILDGIGPKGDEIVIAKTSAGVFNSTNIDYVLRNLGIEHIVVTGVVTNGCVEITVRDGADKGYRVALIEDCCAAFTKDLHEDTIARLKEVFAKIYVTDEILSKINNL